MTDLPAPSAPAPAGRHNVPAPPHPGAGTLTGGRGLPMMRLPLAATPAIGGTRHSPAPPRPDAGTLTGGRGLPMMRLPLTATPAIGGTRHSPALPRPDAGNLTGGRGLPMMRLPLASTPAIGGTRHSRALPRPGAGNLTGGRGLPMMCLPLRHRTTAPDLYAAARTRPVRPAPWIRSRPLHSTPDRGVVPRRQAIPALPRSDTGATGDKGLPMMVLSFRHLTVGSGPSAAARSRLPGTGRPTDKKGPTAMCLSLPPTRRNRRAAARRLILPVVTRRAPMQSPA